MYFICWKPPMRSGVQSMQAFLGNSVKNMSTTRPHFTIVGNHSKKCIKFRSSMRMLHVYYSLYLPWPMLDTIRGQPCFRVKPVLFIGMVLPKYSTLSVLYFKLIPYMDRKLLPMIMLYLQSTLKIRKLCSFMTKVLSNSGRQKPCTWTLPVDYILPARVLMRLLGLHDWLWLSKVHC